MSFFFSKYHWSGKEVHRGRKLNKKLFKTVFIKTGGKRQTVSLLKIKAHSEIHFDDSWKKAAFMQGLSLISSTTSFAFFFFFETAIICLKTQGKAPRRPVGKVGLWLRAPRLNSSLINCSTPLSVALRAKVWAFLPLSPRMQQPLEKAEGFPSSPRDRFSCLFS